MLVSTSPVGGPAGGGILFVENFYLKTSLRLGLYLPLGGGGIPFVENLNMKTSLCLGLYLPLRGDFLR